MKCSIHAFAGTLDTFSLWWTLRKPSGITRPSNLYMPFAIHGFKVTNRYSSSLYDCNLRNLNINMDSNLVQQIIDIIASCASVDIVRNLDYIITAVEHAIALIGLAEESVELPWTPAVTDALYALAADLEHIRILLENEEQRRKGKRVGRPECHIPRQSLEELLELRFTAKEIAKIYHVCRMTVCRKMKKYNLSVSYSLIQLTQALVNCFSYFRLVAHTPP